MKLFLMMCISSVYLFGISSKQLETLQTVRNIAKSIPDKRGETFEDTISAICLTESSAGKNLIGDFKEGTSITKASLGVMQIQVATVKHVATYRKKFRYLLKKTDAEIANMLLTNIRFSARIATTYLVMLRNARPYYYNAVSGYNGGWNNWTYYSRVQKNLTLVRKLLKKNKLT